MSIPKDFAASDAQALAAGSLPVLLSLQGPSAYISLHW